MDRLELFPPTPEAAHARIAAVRPVNYARTRNALDGAVSGLSPYITHGFVDLAEVAAAVAAKQPPDPQNRFMFELGWRAYFRHVWQHRGEGIFRSLHSGPLPDEAYSPVLPADVREARTGVPVIDTAVRTLYATGYLHNHARMWLASYVVHLRRIHWRAGADWLYAHLLDGDLASNHLSWQWVAGTASAKPYLFNADNVARYAPAPWHSRGGPVDVSYETLDAIAQGGTLPALCAPGAGMDEPSLHIAPPWTLQVMPASSNAVRHRDVWLVHPWALRAPPDDLPADALHLAVCPSAFHTQWPWSARRWAFVGARMGALSSVCWHDSAAAIAGALQSARSVRSVDDAHLDAALRATFTPEPAGRLFADVEVPCASFSKWWKQVSAGASPIFQRQEETT